MRTEKHFKLAWSHVENLYFELRIFEKHDLEFWGFWVLVPGISQSPLCVVADAWQGPVFTANRKTGTPRLFVWRHQHLTKPKKKINKREKKVNYH